MELAIPRYGDEPDFSMVTKNLRDKDGLSIRRAHNMLVACYLLLIQTRQDTQIHAEVTINLLVTPSNENYATNV